jgi:hypothetical protein
MWLSLASFEGILCDKSAFLDIYLILQQAIFGLKVISSWFKRFGAVTF